MFAKHTMHLSRLATDHAKASILIRPEKLVSYWEKKVIKLWQLTGLDMALLTRYACMMLLFKI